MVHVGGVSMSKYLNVPDVLLILAAGYLFVWAINGALRHMQAGEFQA